LKVFFPTDDTDIFEGTMSELESFIEYSLNKSYKKNYPFTADFSDGTLSVSDSYSLYSESCSESSFDSSIGESISEEDYASFWVKSHQKLSKNVKKRLKGNGYKNIQSSLQNDYISSWFKSFDVFSKRTVDQYKILDPVKSDLRKREGILHWLESNAHFLKRVKEASKSMNTPGNRHFSRADLKKWIRCNDEFSKKLQIDHDMFS